LIVASATLYVLWESLLEELGALEEDDPRGLEWKGLVAVGVMDASLPEGSGWEDTRGLPPLPDWGMIRDFVAVGSGRFVYVEGIGGFDGG
jgi:hypothetical protein